jgi:hypothetical protein
MIDGGAFVPNEVNRGLFVTAYTVDELERRIADARVVLPICRLGTTPEQLSELGPLILPPLYREAMTDKLQDRIAERIRHCFPYEYVNPQLVDARWWPGRLDELAAGQMSVPQAVELSNDVSGFIRHVDSRPLNGIVGDIRNYFNVDAAEMMERMVDAARVDVRRLLADTGE